MSTRCLGFLWNHGLRPCQLNPRTGHLNKTSHRKAQNRSISKTKRTRKIKLILCRIVKKCTVSVQDELTSNCSDFRHAIFILRKKNEDNFIWIKPVPTRFSSLLLHVLILWDLKFWLKISSKWPKVKCGDHLTRKKLCVNIVTLVTAHFSFSQLHWPLFGVCRFDITRDDICRIFVVKVPEIMFCSTCSCIWVWMTFGMVVWHSKTYALSGYQA